MTTTATPTTTIITLTITTATTTTTTIPRGMECIIPRAVFVCLFVLYVNPNCQTNLGQIWHEDIPRGGDCS